MDIEYRLYHAASNVYRWVNVRAVPLRAKGGTIRGWIGMNTDIDERKRAEARVRVMASRLTMAEQAERRRIAQILHDDLQQVLYGVEVKLTLVRQDLSEVEYPQRTQLLETACAWIAQAVRLTRQLTVDLSPPILQDEGLADALAWLKYQMHELHRLEITIETEHKWYIPEEDLRVLLFQIVRELLFNVKKHAGVDRATVQLTEEGGLVIHVIDAGQGFDAATAISTESAEGFGLFSIRERLRLLGGHLVVQSQPGQGTHVKVYAPVQRQFPA